ncbi:MAG TPA: hypothetical protein VIT90_17080 [Lysobacter sp.]
MEPLFLGLGPVGVTSAIDMNDAAEGMFAAFSDLAINAGWYFRLLDGIEANYEKFNEAIDRLDKA